MTEDVRSARRGASSRADGHLSYHLLVLATLALVAFGLVMVYSASSARAIVLSGDPAYYLKRQALSALLGVAALVLCSRLPARVWRRLCGPLLVGSLLLLLFVLVGGTNVNGARRWLSLGLLDFQPSELAKLALVLWLAAILAHRGPPRTFGELLRPIGVVVAVFSGLILLEPDLGTTVAILAMVVAMVLVAGTPYRVLAAASGLCLPLLAAAIWLEPYRRARFLSFLDPWSDPQVNGYQTIQAQLALGSGGLFGQGLGESVQKVLYLPEASTDMILAVIGEELGFLGILAVVLAFGLVGFAGFSVALRARDPYTKLVAAGATALVCGQAALNICAVLGLAPLTGVPLPFVSYGGTSLVVSLALVGIVLNIAVNDGAHARASLPDRGGRDRRPRDAGARRRRGFARSRSPRHVRGYA